MTTIARYSDFGGLFLKKNLLNLEPNPLLMRRGIFALYGSPLRIEKPAPGHPNCMATLTEDARCAECGKEFEP
jgi:hypothetical protein